MEKEAKMDKRRCGCDALEWSRVRVILELLKLTERARPLYSHKDRPSMWVVLERVWSWTKELSSAQTILQETDPWRLSADSPPWNWGKKTIPWRGISHITVSSILPQGNCNTRCSKEPIYPMINNIPIPSSNSTAQISLERAMTFYGIIIKDKSKFLNPKSLWFKLHHVPLAH